jgi:hypothetical protein
LSENIAVQIFNLYRATKAIDPVYSKVGQKTVCGTVIREVRNPGVLQRK